MKCNESIKIDDKSGVATLLQKINGAPKIIPVVINRLPMPVQKFLVNKHDM